MNEIFLFYWFSWLFVVIVYFFMETYKYYFLFLLFFIMLTININVTLNKQIHINVAFFILFIGAVLFYAYLSFTYTELFTILIVSFSYTALLLWEKVTPIWFIIHPLLMIPLINGFMISWMNKVIIRQIMIATISLSLSHLLFGFILIIYRLSGQVVEIDFFIMLFNQISLLLLLQMFMIIWRYVKMNISF